MSRTDPSISLGFTWADNDRYEQEVCRVDPQAARLATCLETEPFHHVPDFVRPILHQAIEEWFQAIPVIVHFVQREPYNDLAALVRDVQARKCMRVRHHLRHPSFGTFYEKLRAVHDYFGHYEIRAPFTLSGELGAYARHAHQFPHVALPAIFSNVVLENAFRLNRGHWHCYPSHPSCPPKVVFDEQHFGKQGEWYKQRLG